jgi:flagellar assembly protein FliH
MRTATKFTFGTDFGEVGRRGTSEADLAAVKAEAFRAGEAQARLEAESQLNGLAHQLVRSCERLLAQEEQRSAAIEAQAARVAIATARALAGAALAAKPLGEIEHAVRECLAHARHAPHLVVRVNDAAVEEVEALIRRVAQETAFAGRLVVLGEPDIMPGDGRIEWADGGFAIDSERLSRLVEQAVTAVFGPAPLNGDER